MAPKRHRGEGSSSGAARTYDHTKFVSEAASERFHAYLISNNLILERGLVLFEYNGRVIRNMIAERGWETLTTQPEAVRVVIVKEFNANAARLEIKAIIRGKSVSFDSVAINAYYNLAPIENDEFT